MLSARKTCLDKEDIRCIQSSSSSTPTYLDKTIAMNEINAWGAYEAGATQTARRLDGGKIQRRPNRSSIERRPHTHDLLSETKNDVDKTPMTLNEKTDVPEGHAGRAQEWREMRDLARSVFHVYFTKNDCDDDDIAQLNQSDSLKKPSLLKKINGTMPWLPEFIIKSGVPNIVKAPVLFMEATFRGMAQVFFQNNPLSGLLILIALFIQSPRVAVHGIIAIVCGNLAGLLMGFDESFLTCGLFGYNAFLVGLTIATFDTAVGYSWAVGIGAVIASYFSIVLFVMLGKVLATYKTPPFSLPYNISTLVFFLVMQEITENEVDEEPLVSATPLTAKAFFAGSIRGVGQVFLANNIISCFLILVSIMFCSRISAVAAFVGSLVGAAVAALVGRDAASIEDGLYGFNSSLIATAIVMFYVPSLGSVSFGIVASVMSVFIQLALEKILRVHGLPFMSLPFDLSALAFIVIQGTTLNVISVPLSTMTTPEDHLERVERLSSGFDLLFRAIKSAAYEGSILRKRLIRFKARSSSNIIKGVLKEVHGGEEKDDFWKSFKELLCRKRYFTTPTRDYCHGKKNDEALSDDAKTPYMHMFSYIDEYNAHSVCKSQFEAFLKSFGLDGEVGLRFALEAFDLMDLDGSGDIDLDEFTAFAKICRNMPAIRSLIVKFFDFVDVNGDRAVSISDLDSACEYLGLPSISDADRESLEALSNREGELEFDTIVNFVTIFQLKSAIRDYQNSRDQGLGCRNSRTSSEDPYQKASWPLTTAAAQRPVEIEASNP